MDLALIGVGVDTRPLKEGKAEIENLTRAGVDAERRLSKSTGEMTDGFSNVTAAIRVAYGALVAMGVVRFAGEATQYADSWKQVNNQLRQVTGSEIALTRIREQMLEISRETNAELEGTTELYTSLFRATRDLNTEQSVVAEVTKTINNLFLAGGKAASETAGAVRQLAQGLAAGALRGDEFNSVAEGAPRILDAVAAYTGMATGELREFAAQGGITASLLVKALAEYSDEAQTAADMTERTFGQKMVNARTNVTQLIGEMEQLNGSVDSFGDGLLWLSGALKENADILDTAIGVAAAAIGGALVTALGRATLAQNTFNLAVLRNPYVIAAVGFGAAALAVMEYAKAQDEATNATRRFGDAVDDALLSMQNLSLTEIDRQIREQMGLIREISAARDELTRPAPGVNVYAYVANMVDYIQTSRELDDALDEAATQAAALARARIALTTATDESSESNTEFGGSFGEVNDAVIAATDALFDYNTEQDRLLRKHFPLLNAHMEYEDALTDLYKLFYTGRISQEQYAEATARVTAEYEEQINSINGVTESAGEMGGAVVQALSDAERAAEEFARTYNNMIEGIQSGWSDGIFDMLKETEFRFDSLWETVLDGYLRMLSEMLSRNVVDMVFGGKQMSLANLFNGMGPAHSAIGNALGNIPGMSQFGQNSGLTKIKNSFGVGFTDDAGNPVGFSQDMFLQGLKDLGLNIVGSYAGGKVGSKLGESIFSKEAESNIGQQIGSAIGTWLGGAPGAFIGSTIGSMIDVAAGGDGYVRQNAGMLVGNTPGAKPEHTFAVDPFASGLQVTGFARREDQAIARQNIEMFRGFDSVVTSLARDLNGMLNVTSLNGLNQEATPGSSGTYLGSGRDADLLSQVDYFVTQLASNITGLDDALMDSIRSATTAEEVIQTLNDALERQTRLQHMDGLRALIGTDAVSMAREQFSAQTGLLHVYQQTNNAIRLMSAGYTGTVEQTMAMTQALQMQRSAAYDLTTAYLETQVAVSGLFGGLSESIRKSVMGQEELYNYERAQVDSLTSLLGTLTDPEALYSTAQEIERRVSAMWSRVDEAARPGMADGFTQYLDRTEEILQERLAAGLASVEKTQTDINHLLSTSLESAASQITSAAEMERQTAEMNRQTAAMNLRAAELNARSRGAEANA